MNATLLNQTSKPTQRKKRQKSKIVHKLETNQTRTQSHQRNGEKLIPKSSRQLGATFHGDLLQPGAVADKVDQALHRSFARVTAMELDCQVGNLRKASRGQQTRCSVHRACFKHQLVGLKTSTFSMK